MSARLNMQEIPYIPWKGKTFSQIIPTVRKNVNRDENAPEITPRLSLTSQPLKIYRKEISSIALNTCNRQTSTQLSHFEIPGGTIVNSKISDMSCNGIVTTLDPVLPSNSSEYPGSSCDASPCLSTANNALKRVRRSGIITPKYNLDNRQYLQSKNKTFNQNTFHSLRYGDGSAVPGSAKSVSNAYASNTFVDCDTSNTSVSTYVPVYYKPNNSKFAEQGAVSSSARLLRLKYDTITTGGSLMNTAFGTATTNALSYSTLENPYSLKTQTGYPLTKTPVISKWTGEVLSCTNTKRIS
jgi:hypothetical protein